MELDKVNSKIIGITGAFGSGKSTAAAFFESKGFKKIILSQFLEEEARKRGIKEITRKILQNIGNEWREEYGVSILGEKALEKILAGRQEKIVVDGIRNIGEVEKLRNSGNFILIAMLSDRTVRFDRLKNLRRRESLTWEIFEKLDSRDAGAGEKETGLQVDRCIGMADVRIENNGSEKEFRKKLEYFLTQYEK
ncbi:MAG: AAA family ATPase [Candidatus Levyibacteriota bacterium]